MRDERHAEHVARDALGIVGRSGELDAAALAAASGVNLRLHDDHAAAETLGDLARVGGGGRHFPARDRNAVALEDGFGLVLVNFHAGKRLIVIRGCADRQYATPAQGLATALDRHHEATVNFPYMATRLRVFSSSVGTKLVIGVTGFLLFLYLLIHIGGNLLVFFGPDVFNRYAYVMEEQNPLLPLIELGSAGGRS